MENHKSSNGWKFFALLHQRFSLFPDSPHMRQVFSARSIRARWRNNDPVVTVAIMLVCIALWIAELLLGFLAPQLLNGLLQFGMFQPASAFREPDAPYDAVSQLNWLPLNAAHTIMPMPPPMPETAYSTRYAQCPMRRSRNGPTAHNVSMLNRIWNIDRGSCRNIDVMNVHGSRNAEAGWNMPNCSSPMPLITPNIAWQAHLGGFVVGGLLTLLTIDGVPALRRTSTLVRIGIYGGVFVVIMAVVFAFCNAGNPALQPMVWTANLG